jgi:hypothetical protein
MSRRIVKHTTELLNLGRSARFDFLTDETQTHSIVHELRESAVALFFGWRMNQKIVNHTPNESHWQAIRTNFYPSITMIWIHLLSCQKLLPSVFLSFTMIGTATFLQLTKTAVTDSASHRRAV